MADEPTTTDEEETGEQPVAEDSSVETVEDLQSHLDRLIQWASASRLRIALIGSLAFIILGCTFATWSYLAHLAVREKDPATLARALEAMDNNDFEKARSIVGRMKYKANEAYALGGSLLVLGTVKAAEAEQEWSIDRKRTMYLVAARYLQRSYSLGVPPVRENQLNFLLGKSLILGNQALEGIEALKSSLDVEGMPITQIHALLSDAYLAIPDPDLESALEHNQAVLSDDSLDEQLRTKALISKVDILRQLGRTEEASKTLESADGNPSLRALAKSISGRLAFSIAQKLPKDSEERATRIEEALANLREAQREDPLNGKLTRQAMYWIGRCYELSGKTPAAIEQYDRVGKLYGDTPESISATLSKANLERVSGEIELALADYRAVLESVGEPATYVNRMLPLSKLQKNLNNAHAYFVDQELFEEALSLTDQFTPVFDQVEVTEMRGKTLEKWGAFEILQASEADQRQAQELSKKGRYHLRAAGRDFETLAQLRFATQMYTEDLWRAAENYYQGQNYTHSAKVLEEYLYHEARRNKARALLRLGQSLSAISQIEKAITAYEECIEMHPHDADIYQARLDCMRAYRQLGNKEKAEELLLSNLRGEQLMPSSPEWRDSLFALGELQHDTGQYDEAIKRLNEAVSRYPDAPQSLFARYTVARSYHNAAEKPAAKIREAKTESERQKNRKLRDQNLKSALKNYLTVQRVITLGGSHGESSDLKRALLRNCYMMQGSVLFQMKRYEDARRAYSNVSTLYQNEPFVLETFVHIANCWSRLNQPVKARGSIEQAKLMLDTLPLDTDFKLETNFNRQQWNLLLAEMSKW